MRYTPRLRETPGTTKRLRVSGSARATFRAAVAPLAVFGIAIAALPLLRGGESAKFLLQENSILELGTFVSILAAALLAFWLAPRMHRGHGAAASVALSMFGIGCLFIAGEEIAWGQWFFAYETPLGLRDLNTQGEMTLHNIEGLQGKSEAFRMVFGLGGLLGIVLGRHRLLKAVAPPSELLGWFVLIAFFGAGELLTDWVTLPIEPIHDGLRSKLFSEFQELVIAVVALVYVVALARRASLRSNDFKPLAATMLGRKRGR